MPSLKISQNGHPSFEFQLSGRRIKLGRNPDCDVVLHCKRVSRVHAEIVAEADSYWLRDKGSTNGTYLNATPVSAERSVLLKHRDVVAIGGTKLVFHDPLAILTPRPPGVAFDPRATEPGGAEPAATEPEPRDSGAVVETPNEPLEDDDRLDDSRVRRALSLDAPEALESRLAAVVRASETLGGLLSAEDLVDRLARIVPTVFRNTERVAILLPDEEGHLRLRDDRRNGSRTALRSTLGPSEQRLVKDVIKKRRALLVNDEIDPAAVSVAQGHSRMAAPLLNGRNSPLGVILVDTESPHPLFTSDDLDTLAALGAVAGLALASAKLHETRLRDDSRVREQRMAKTLQQAFLPSGAPPAVGFEFASHYEPCKGIGGDYFDYVPMPDGRLAVAVGDVTGKGAPAAMLMARLGAELRDCLVLNKSADGALKALNTRLQRVGRQGVYVSFCLALLESRRGRVEFALAGHPPPLLRLGRTGEVMEFQTQLDGSPWLGMEESPEYLAQNVVLAEGDTVLIYTDGVTELFKDPEAKDSEADAQVMFGRQGLLNVFANAPDAPRDVLPAVLAALGKFQNSPALRLGDDVCMVCFRKITD